ncbi:putative dimeric dihydrodiol dehydrogenase [Coleophoma crateriformis]|uniref:D-xylose 1-dehydrogenase (NADP(+), D-xylono-1,5-lactone-forming) n=1 Tax=Coleophoma crateriformis TaxID=565419 RepID=A0A3D8SB43_9HELO|nr:putative dimeric dihydrodiol dehydrogenase [Coleophoma crateriformis]
MAAATSDVAKTATPGVHTTRWGILATGWMAGVFVKDLLGDPLVRNVTDVRHEVVAVASSSSIDRATKFIGDHGVPSTAKAYGSYEELVNDPNVDIVYVATPHSHHYQNAMLALRAGKPVLVEKAFTTNAQQAKALMATAKEKNLFLMEAIWTRYIPISKMVQDIVTEGTIGEVQRVFADMSFGEDIEKRWGTKKREVNLDLAGGALLDLGVYALTWVFQILYHLQPEPRQAPTVLSTVTKYELTGADEQTSILLTFPTCPASKGSTRRNPTHGIATCGMRASSDPDGKGSTGAQIKIQGTKGEIQVFGPPFRPTRFRLIPKLETTSGEPVGRLTEVEDVEIVIPGPGLEKGGHGMFWEADEAARCLRDGKLESSAMDWEEVVAVMEVMDKVREQNGIVYPQAIETTEFPINLPS